MSLENEDDEVVADALEILLGDWQRKGELAIDDVTRIAERRRLSPEQLHAVLIGLKAEGIIAVDVETGDIESERPVIRDRPKAARLTREEEQRLANSMRVARKLEAEGGDADSGLVEHGQRAREEFIVRNLRLVHWVAHRCPNSLDYDDRVQEGIKGLIKAVEMFDPDLGYKFATYATWWIEQAIRRAIDDTANEIRIPVHRVQQIRWLRRMVRRLRIERGGEPTTRQLAAALDWSVEKTAFIADLATYRTIDIDTPVHAGSSLTIKDGLADLDLPSPEAQAIHRALSEQLNAMIADLPPRTRYIIEQRFGLGTGHERTLEDLGREHGLTRERIRQIEAKGLGKLRHPARTKALSTFRE